MHLTKQKSRVKCIFLVKGATKRQTRKSVKKVLQKGRNYGIL